MSIILSIAFVVFNGLIFYLDLRDREVPLLLFLLLFFISLFGFSNSINIVLLNMIGNTTLLLILSLAILIYFKIKKIAINNKEDASIIDNKIGKGDILFFFCITPLYQYELFILIIILSCTISLFANFILTYMKNSWSSIPFAGIAAITILIHFILLKFHLIENVG